MPSLADFQSYVRLPQVRAALDTIAWAEGGRTYNTLYGGGTFVGDQHPNRAIKAGAYTSTAAGRYQFLNSTWRGIARKLGLTDFGPASQDIGAVYLIWERGQLAKLLEGDFEGTMRGLGCLWAALPYSTCGQRRRGLVETMNYYNAALRASGGPVQVSTAGLGGIGSQLGMAALGFVLLVLLLDD